MRIYTPCLDDAHTTLAGLLVLPLTPDMFLDGLRVCGYSVGSDLDEIARHRRAIRAIELTAWAKGFAGGRK